MTTQIDQSLLDTAVEITREAGELTKRWFRSDALDTELKSDGTPVTAADKAAERLIRERLAEQFPDDAIFGEEEAPTEGTSGRTWVIDPIDGTKAFTHGVPLYTNLLALDDGDGNAVGVINIPALGETVYAGRGLGCFWDGERAQVSSTTDVESSWITSTAFSNNVWSEADFLALHRSGASLRTWGDGYGYALVATGRVDAMIDPIVARWDVAPMPVILNEAGGRFSDWTGAVTAVGGNGIATNGVLHDDLLDRLGAA
jgi:histidinol-phosphatase